MQSQYRALHYSASRGKNTSYVDKLSDSEHHIQLLICYKPWKFAMPAKMITAYREYRHVCHCHVPPWFACDSRCCEFSLWLVCTRALNNVLFRALVCTLSSETWIAEKIFPQAYASGLLNTNRTQTVSVGRSRFVAAETDKSHEWVWVSEFYVPLVFRRPCYDAITCTDRLPSLVRAPGTIYLMQSEIRLWHSQHSQNW